MPDAAWLVHAVAMRREHSTSSHCRSCLPCSCAAVAGASWLRLQKHPEPLAQTCALLLVTETWCPVMEMTCHAGAAASSCLVDLQAGGFIVAACLWLLVRGRCLLQQHAGGSTAIEGYNAACTEPCACKATWSAWQSVLWHLSRAAYQHRSQQPSSQGQSLHGNLL